MPNSGPQVPSSWDPAEATKALLDERNVMDSTHEQQAQELFRQHLPVAALSIVHLAQYGQAEGVKLNAAKFIYDSVLGKDGKGGGDAIDRLLAEFEESARRGAS